LTSQAGTDEHPARPRNRVPTASFCIRYFRARSEARERQFPDRPHARKRLMDRGFIFGQRGISLFALTMRPGCHGFHTCRSESLSSSTRRMAVFKCGRRVLSLVVLGWAFRAGRVRQPYRLRCAGSLTLPTASNRCEELPCDSHIRRATSLELILIEKGSVHPMTHLLILSRFGILRLQTASLFRLCAGLQPGRIRERLAFRAS